MAIATAMSGDGDDIFSLVVCTECPCSDERRRARDENAVRVKDGERREGWRGLEEILEKTEQRLSFISF